MLKLCTAPKTVVVVVAVFLLTFMLLLSTAAKKTNCLSDFEVQGSFIIKP